MSTERDIDLLRDRQNAQGRRLDAVEEQQDEQGKDMTALDKTVAVVLVELGMMRDSSKATRVVVGGAAVAVIGAAVALVLFGGPK